MTTAFTLRQAACWATVLVASLAHGRIGVFDAVGPQHHTDSLTGGPRRVAEDVDGVALRFWDEGASQPLYR